METNYKVKHRRILMPLKLVLLLVAMALFGYTSYAQQGEAARVSNFQQLEQALENPLVGYIVLDETFQGPTDRDYLSQVLRAKTIEGDKSFNCAYVIVDNDTCFFDPADDNGYVHNKAAAFSVDLGGGGCPGDDAGYWIWNTTNPDVPPPPGSDLLPHFLNPPYTTSDTLEFSVNHAGVYTLRYNWGAPWNSYVQTEYKFYSPFSIDYLYAPDVCGLETSVDIEISAFYGDPQATIHYYLYNPCQDITVDLTNQLPALQKLWYYDDTQNPPYPIDNDTIQVENFMITAPDYGLWQFIVLINDGECTDLADTIDIEFSAQPMADAGPDQEICADQCAVLVGYPGTWFDNPCYQATNFAYTWVQISGPTTLTINPVNGLTTQVCGTTNCWYGEYEVAFMVQNGECEDADTVKLTFYEEPTADAGDDQYICGDLCFSLEAMPYQFCSPPLDDERYAYWELVTTPNQCGNNILSWNPQAPATGVCVDGSQCCPYGEYIFKYVEVNGTCRDSDYVSIFLFEEPVADAGPDSLTTCFYEGCFNIIGNPYEYCSGMPEGFTRTHSWELISHPVGFDPDCGASWGEVPGAAYLFEVCAGTCPCPWGEFTVAIHEYNNDPAGNAICMDSDTIHFFLFEPPVADAGEDFEMCYSGGCFSLDAMPYSYCSDADPNWGDRYGEWTKIGGPAMVSFDDPNNPQASACPDEANDCPYGVYTFQWTEYNGDCSDADQVVVTLYEAPTADAGDDAWYCIDNEFSYEELWHTFAAVPYEYCQNQGLDTYTYWSKCGGPGYVSWYDQDSPNAYVHVSCFGCYCFVYHEVNGDCEDTDTVEVCFYEHPYLTGRDLVDSACTTIPVCYDLSNLGITPYVYDDCENYNVQYWTLVSGGGNATFDPDPSDPNATVCVDNYGCYTFQFIQYNGDVTCADTLEAQLFFFEQPEANAGDDASICGNCYMMSAMPYSYVVTDCHPADDASHFWAWFSYIPPDDYCGFPQEHWACFNISDIFDPAAEVCVCDNEDYGYGPNYGTYGFIWTEINGTCEDQDTVWIEFKKEPDPLPLSGCVSDSYCGNGNYLIGPNRDVTNCGCVECIWPEDTVITVCAGTCAQYSVFDWYYGQEGPVPYSYCLDEFAIPGYTYEWSFIGPSGSVFNADPLWYDCSCDEWRGSPYVSICFGECCDTARLYLTITSPEGCETTEEWKFFVQHRPDATLSGPEIAEVGDVFEYSVPDGGSDCYLYVWEVQFCGQIVYGQGTGTIGVEWDDAVANGGWGLIYVEVYDTCTCCCNTDSLMVRVLPAGSLGDSTLSGHVYYDNAYMTPLNGVKLTLWNGDVPIFETYSFNDIEGGNGVGYYSFEGLDEITEFGLTAEYTAPWYGANATDALAIELKVINPGGYTWDDVQMEAGDVNASGALSATDALWVKQRAIAMVNFFPAGDWAFADMSTMAMNGYDVYTLNYGDVNRSNVPSSNKDLPAIAMVTDGTINVVQGEVFDLPIRVADAVSLGAITLNLGYNSNLLEVVDVIPVPGALSNVSSTNIAMAWSDVNPMVLNNNDAIVTLRMKALDKISSSDLLFTIDLGTEFADPNATVLENLKLKTFGISTDPAATDYFLSYNRPNPFSQSTQIEYTLPETGKVRLSVVDLLGQEIATLVNNTQSAGSYTVQFNAAGLTPGVYIYKITVQGDSRDFVETRRMVISH